MTLENFVKLMPETEKVLRFKTGSFRVEETTITDPRTKQPKRVRRAVLDVTEEDYRPAIKTLSVLSEKLASQLRALHENGDLYRYHIALTKRAAELATEYTIRVF